MIADVVLRDGSTLQLRGAVPGDEAGLSRLRSELAGHGQTFRLFDSPDGTTASLGQFLTLDQAEGAVLVGEAGGRLQAMAGFRRGHDDRAEVVVAVAPALQGRGVGTRLLETLADAARARGVAWFDARVSRDDRALIDLFRSSGFDFEQQPAGGLLQLSLHLTETPRFLELSAARAREAAAASMRGFFEPRAVAIIGASREPGKIGSEILSNLTGAGFTGPIYPIHPAAGRLGGLQAYRRVVDVPGPVDLAVIVVPAAAVAGVVDDCLAKGVKAIVVISAGFAETGAAGRALEATLVENVRAAGVRMVGPNCMGLINTNPAVRLNATFSPVYPPAGHVAMSTQSGALGLAILDYARRLDLGISTFVSVGNKADVSSNDLIQYWLEDDRTRVILLYLESFGNPRKFSQIARRVAREKPIVAVKSGRSAAGARAASSHTGALATSDAIVDALFRQAGVIRTNTLEELFDVAILVAHQPVPRGRRVAILTNAGGPGILAADACEAQGLALPRLGDRTVAALTSFLPPAAAVGNPVDMIASASADDYGRTLAAVLADDAVDSALVIFIPPLVTKADDVARAIKASAAAVPGKPVLGIFMSADQGSAMLSPIPCFAFPEAAAVALARAAAYGEWLATPPGAVPSFPDLDTRALRAIVSGAVARGGGWLTPSEAQSLITAAGVPAAASRVAAGEDEAVRAAEAIGFPVVLKAIGPAILHKTEMDAVRLGVADAAAVRGVWRDFTARLGASMTGVLVQEMVRSGVEMLVGATEDPVFGPVIACATGGVLSELLGDAEFRLHPLTERDAASMVSSLRGAALLRGYRGAPAADEAALRDALLRISALIGECPEIQEMDINPLAVLPQGVKAIDVRVRVARPGPPARTRRVIY
ncbi:MAG TPA: GNAT family N-acetyltransferase [Vicinamibacterales bacterium]|nr:GNAT family N-acetyltransferase [Vicinamibacterales bacterium]